jgi:hypothetical protein
LFCAKATVHQLMTNMAIVSFAVGIAIVLL